MSEILGYDCNGKALRAGDEAVVLQTTCSRYSYLIGETVKILFLSKDHPGCVAINRVDLSRGGRRLVGSGARDRLAAEGGRKCLTYWPMT